jgi:hypothetical protein
LISKILDYFTLDGSPGDFQILEEWHMRGSVPVAKFLLRKKSFFKEF